MYVYMYSYNYLLLYIIVHFVWKTKGNLEDDSIKKRKKKKKKKILSFKDYLRFLFGGLFMVHHNNHDIKKRSDDILLPFK